MRETAERYVERVGTTDDGAYMVVTVELGSQGGDWQTVTHETVTAPQELSVTGALYAKHADRKRRDSISGGQNRDDLAAITRPAPGWTLEEIAELGAIWDRWHLNTMRAACAHMDPANLAREDDGYGGSRISTRHPDNVCPETGYKYGHAWLTEELPAEVVARVRHLMRDRSADLYKSRGYDASGKPVK